MNQLRKSRFSKVVGMAVLAVITSAIPLGNAAGVSAQDPPVYFEVDGSPAACVAAYVGQGLPLDQAATLCEVSIGVIPGGGEISGGTANLAGLVGSLPNLRNTESGPVNVSCASPSGIDPTLSTTPEEDALNLFDKKNPPPSDPAERAKYWHDRNALVDAAVASRAALDAARVDMDQRKQDAIQTSNGLKALGGETSTSNHVVVKTPKADGGVKQTVDTVTTACQAMAAFVGECNLAGWATSPCQMLRHQMSGCGDQTIAFTTGEPGDGCKPTVDGKTVAAVVEMRCSLMGKVAPGFDPCGPPELGGGPGIYRLLNGDVCQPNPWMATARGEIDRTSGDGCEQKFEATVPKALERTPSIGTMVVVLGGPGGPSGAGGGEIAPPPGCKVCGY